MALSMDHCDLARPSVHNTMDMISENWALISKAKAGEGERLWRWEWWYVAQWPLSDSSLSCSEEDSWIRRVPWAVTHFLLSTYCFPITMLFFFSKQILSIYESSNSKALPPCLPLSRNPWYCSSNQELSFTLWAAPPHLLFRKTTWMIE